MSRQAEREILLELHQIANAAKVTAVDTVTLVEVSIVGPPGAGEEALKRIAIRKLDYVLAKRERGRQSGR